MSGQSTNIHNNLSPIQLIFKFGSIIRILGKHANHTYPYMFVIIKNDLATNADTVRFVILVVFYTLLLGNDLKFRND